MTPDKEHAPALMQQASDEAGLRVLELVKGCVTCPRRRYYSGGRYECMVTGDVLPWRPELDRIVFPSNCPLTPWPSAVRSAPTYEQGVAAGLEMAAKVADDLCMDASGFTEEEHAYGAVAKAIHALADQHKGG